MDESFVLPLEFAKGPHAEEYIYQSASRLYTFDIILQRPLNVLH